MRAWLTIDEPGVETCRVFHIPENFVPHVMGALGELTYADNWEQDGTLTPDECAEFMGAMWESIRGCGVIGEVKYFATATLPAGFLPCDGATYNRVDYPLLYSALHSSFIVDADHFITPGVSDRVIAGSGTTLSVGDTVGNETHTMTIEELVPHDHTIPWLATFPYGEIPEISVVGGILTQNTGQTGNGEPFSIVQPTIALLVGIRYQ